MVKMKTSKMKGGGVVSRVKMSDPRRLVNEKHFVSVVAAFPEAFVSGAFCDVKIVCADTSLWAHRIILGSVSPFLQQILTNYEKEGDDVITILLPMIKGYHMKLVLDYIYSGAMYLCGAHMQYVIQVMEVLQLKCGVSVNKIVGQDSGELIEVEHSTVTIKTDLDEKFRINGDHNILETKGRLRRRSGTELPCSIERVPLKTKPVKRKRQSDVSDAENNDVQHVMNNGTEHNSLDITTVSSAPAPPVTDHHRDSKVLSDTRQEHIDSDDDDDVDNDVVMVELEEEFVVEKVGGCNKDSSDDDSLLKQTEEKASDETKVEKPQHRCSICQRTFKHYINLQVHLTGHLGVKVNLFRCSQCRKNFRNQTELTLHNRAHRAAQILDKVRTNKRVTVNKVVKKKKLKKVITTSGTADKKIIRKYLKDPSIQSKPSKASSPLKNDKKSLVKPVPKKDLTCFMCDKSFGVKSLFLRHVKKCHPELAQTLESHSQLKTLPKINIKKCLLPSQKSPKSPAPSSSTPASPSTPRPSVKTPKSQISTPKMSSSSKSSKKKDRRQSSSSSLAPELPDYYNTLECPDCDKVFIAKSIFERHLQSAKHGIYGQCNSSQESDYGGMSPMISSAPVTPVVQGPALPHWTTVSPGLTESGEQAAKIECHLCGQSFMRVKDLAKHREKMCQAYHT